MKNYVKHIFCLLMAVQMIAISACRKTDANAQVATERRDSLVGKYYCADHYNYWGLSAGGDTITGYDTLTISKSSTSSVDILLNGDALSPQSRTLYIGYKYIGGYLNNQAIFSESGDTISYLYSEIDGGNGGSRRYYRGSKIR